MAQAKTLTPAELEQVLTYVAQRRFALRNRVMLLTGFWSGMRVGEIASLSIGDVVNTDGSIKQEVRLTPSATNPQPYPYTQRQQAIQVRKPLQPSTVQNQPIASKDAENGGEQVEKTIPLYRRQA